MEALSRGIASNSVPAAWMAVMSTRVQEVGAAGGHASSCCAVRAPMGKAGSSGCCTMCINTLSQQSVIQPRNSHKSHTQNHAHPPHQVLSLSAWYADVLKRYDQLAVWTAGSITPPNSVWLPGLFNPKVRGRLAVTKFQLMLMLLQSS